MRRGRESEERAGGVAAPCDAAAPCCCCGCLRCCRSLPEVVGDARGYELTGNGTQAAIAAHFFAALTAHHSYPTGGSSDGEMWGTPDLLG